MDSKKKDEIYNSIVDKYLSAHTKKFEKRFEDILLDLSTQNKRSMIIIGCAYLEELCKSCVYETMTKKGRKEYKKRNSRDLTFSSAITFLYSQDYFSEEIFNLINHIRDIRNKYSHLPIIEENHTQSINDRNKKIRDLLNGRWFTRNIERIKNIRDADKELYYIVFENLIFGLIGLEMFINPDQKLGKLEFVKGQKHLKIFVDVGKINEYTETYFSNKFDN